MISLYQKYLRTVNWFLWKPVDFDKKYANQCVDWIKVYARSLWYPVTTKWNAKDFAVLWLWKNWGMVKWAPWVWDIVVFPTWTYGHIAVVQSIDWNTINVIDQNADWKANHNNNEFNLWTPVSYSSYRLKWNEVYFRVKS